MAFECPSCNRPLYNRRRFACEFCGATVPEELLLTPKQRAALDKLKESEPKRHPPLGFGGGDWVGVDGAWSEPGDLGGGGE